MALVQNDLWRHILWRPTESPRLLPKPNLLGKAKVDLRERFFLFFGWTSTLNHIYCCCFSSYSFIYIHISSKWSSKLCKYIIHTVDFIIALDVFGRAAACWSAKSYKLHYSRGKEELAATQKPQNLTCLKYLFLILKIYFCLLPWGVQMSLYCIHYFFKRCRKCES